MTKKELKTCMLVRLRESNMLWMVMLNMYLDDCCFATGFVTGALIGPNYEMISLAQYNEDMTHKVNSRLDIVEVMISNQPPIKLSPSSHNKTIWVTPKSVNFTTAMLSNSRIRLEEPLPYEIPINEFQTVDFVLNYLASLTNADNVRNQAIAARWVIEPIYEEESVTDEKINN